MKRFLKWTGIALGGLVTLVAVLLVVSYFVSEAKLNKTYEVPVVPIAAAADSATLAYGEHLVAVNLCRECHGPNLSGNVFIDAPPFRIVASNLTPGRGGVGQQYNVEDWQRAVRHAVRSSGKPLLFMPAPLYHKLSDEDMAALSVYLEHLPPVDNELPPTELRPLGRVLVAVAGVNPPAAEMDHEAPRAPAPARAPTPAFGAYLASTTCVDCHGADLRGGKHPAPDGPPAPDLAKVGDWTLAEFATALRTGKTPEGRTMSPWMPWKDGLEHLTDVELEALYRYLSNLPPTTEAVAEGR